MPLIDLNGLGHFKDKENEMIAADYSATKTYAVGDYVYYNGVLKRCITAITTAEAYTAAHWTNAVLAGDVTELKTAISPFYNDINSESLWVRGGISSGNGNTTTSTTRLRTSYLPKEIVSIASKNGYKYMIFAYSNGTYQGAWNGTELKKSSAWLTSEVFLSDIGNYDIRLVLAKSDDATIDTTSYSNIMLLATTDPTLSLSGKSADAKATGEAINSVIEDITYYNKNIYPTWNTGGINAPTGAATTTSYMARSAFIYTGEKGLSISVDDSENYWFRVASYTSADYENFDKSYSANDGNIGAGEYIRVWTAKSDSSDPISPYELGFHVIITGKEQYSNSNSRYNHSPYKCKKADFDTWYHCLATDGEFESYSFGRDKSYADTIALYDTLVDGTYVTKNLLDTITITGLGDVPIYEYVFSPIVYTGNVLTQSGNKLYRRTPKILLDGSMHGFEKGSTFGNFLFLYDLVNNWKENKTLQNIRNFCEIRCIPISNPYGFENNTYANENSVNINRNFPCSTWEYSEPGAQGSGDAPADQPETQLLMKWVYDNSDAVLYLVMHTNGQYYTSSYSEMNACLYPSEAYGDSYTHRMFNIFNRHIEQQTLMLPTYYNLITPTGKIGQYQATAKPGTIDVWSLEKTNVIIMTLEGINGLKLSEQAEAQIPLFSKTAICFDAENTGNFIAQFLNEYCED